MTTDDTVAADLGALVLQAKALSIQSPADYRRVAEFALAMKDLRARVAATFDDHIARAYQAHRLLCQEKRDAEAQMVDAEDIAKGLLVTWDTAQRAREEAARLAQEDLLRTEVIGLEKEACIAEDAGDHQRADAIREMVLRMIPEPPAIVPPARPAVAGVTFRETWSARVVDLGALVRAAAEHPSWIALLKPDMTALNAQARSLRARLRIPGVQAVPSRGVATRAPATRDRVDD